MTRALTIVLLAAASMWFAALFFAYAYARARGAEAAAPSLALFTTSALLFALSSLSLWRGRRSVAFAFGIGAILALYFATAPYRLAFVLTVSHAACAVVGLALLRPAPHVWHFSVAVGVALLTVLFVV